MLLTVINACSVLCNSAINNHIKKHIDTLWDMASINLVTNTYQNRMSDAYTEAHRLSIRNRISTTFNVYESIN